MTLSEAVTFLDLLREQSEELQAHLEPTKGVSRLMRKILLEIAHAANPEEIVRLVEELMQLLKTTEAPDLTLQMEHWTKVSPLLAARGATLTGGIFTPPDFAAAGSALDLEECLTSPGEFQYRSVPVFFATDRKASGSDNPNKFFSGQRGDLTFGKVDVSIPDRHEKGHIERPWRFFPESPAKHVTLLNLQTTLQAEFLNSIREALQIAPERKLLLFVHGYNVPFADAARVMAQITFDLNFKTVPILYSWPSQGRFIGYTRDEANAAYTREHFVEFVNALQPIEAEQHVLAHSMGNRVVFQGLQLVSEKRFGQVILAAPDEDAGVLTSQMPRFLGRAARNTLYGSTSDSALRLSQWLHGEYRGGQIGAASVDSIDASAVNFSHFGHSYFHDQRVLLDDIFLLVEHGIPPDRRPSIRPAADGISWIFQP